MEQADLDRMTPLTERLWSDGSSIYADIAAHPFVTGLVDGTLAPRQFGHYVAQDAHYLCDYARALMLVGAKAPTSGEVALFARHAADTIEVELALRTTTLPTLAVDPMTADVCLPTTRAYTRHLLATATAGTFTDGLAAILPCYLVYARLGSDLVDRPIRNPLYRQWVDTYAGNRFADAVSEITAVADRAGTALSPEAENRARAHFTTSARYEWRFWDAAYRGERPAHDADCRYP
jgi:thiaminase/transcriptional activator TenA